MIQQATTWRRLIASLVGLFFVAQICGVVRLLDEHTTHITESQLAVSHMASAGSASHGHHHEGDADGAVQHHELQDLNGALLRLVSACEPHDVPATIVAYLPDILAENSPVLLERPPRPLLSV